MANLRALSAILLLAAGLPAQQFEVATVKRNTSGQVSANIPLGPGDLYVSNGGLFSATGYPLITYLAFAHKLMGNQGQYLLPQMPDWAKTERYDIQARVEGNPTKDQMRTMMRALLAERFGLKMHTESRQVPVLAFVLAKEGKTGPKLNPHPANADCPTNAPPTAGTPMVQTDGLPVYCNGIFSLPPAKTGQTRLAARNVTLKFLADNLSLGANLGRPMVDQTGLTGTFDFLLDYVPDRTRDQPVPNADAPAPEDLGPTLQQALKEQLGITLDSAKGALEVLVLDHVERPSEN